MTTSVQPPTTAPAARSCSPRRIGCGRDGEPDHALRFDDVLPASACRHRPVLERPAQRSCTVLLRRPVAQSSAVGCYSADRYRPSVQTRVKCPIGDEPFVQRFVQTRGQGACTVQTLRADSACARLGYFVESYCQSARSVMTGDCQRDRVRIHRVRCVGSDQRSDPCPASPMHRCADFFGSLSRSRRVERVITGYGNNSERIHGRTKVSGPARA